MRGPDELLKEQDDEAVIRVEKRKKQKFTGVRNIWPIISGVQIPLITNYGKASTKCFPRHGLSRHRQATACGNVDTFRDISL